MPCSSSHFEHSTDSSFQLTIQCLLTAYNYFVFSTHHLLLATYDRLQSTYHFLLRTHQHPALLPATYHFLPATYHFLPATYHLLHSTNYLLYSIYYFLLPANIYDLYRPADLYPYRFLQWRCGTAATGG
jgi:hypothetical protein